MYLKCLCTAQCVYIIHTCILEWLKSGLMSASIRFLLWIINMLCFAVQWTENRMFLNSGAVGFSLLLLIFLCCCKSYLYFNEHCLQSINKLYYNTRENAKPWTWAIAWRVRLHATLISFWGSRLKAYDDTNRKLIINCFHCSRCLGIIIIIDF